MNFKTFYTILIVEGGNVFSDTSVIEQDNVLPTLKEFEKKILLPLFKLSLQDVELLGSALKKSQPSNDLDLAIQTNLDFSSVKYPIPHKINKGLHQVYTKFPQFDKTGKNIPNTFVQIDLMFGDKDYLKFSFHSPSFDESKYKAIYRNLLLFNIARNIQENVIKDEKGKVISRTRFGFDMLNGLVKYDEVLKKTKFDKISKKLITKDPGKITKYLLGDKFTVKDLNSFESIYSALKSKDFKYPNLRKKIIENYKESLSKELLSFPKEIL